jgi:hypothetical protein
VLAALSGGARAISVLSNFFHGNSTRWLGCSDLRCHVLLKVGGGMGIMVRCWVGVLEVYLAHIKFWEGFGCQSSFPEGVRRWHVRDGGFDRCHIPACVFIPRPKCSGGPPAGSVVAAGGWRLLWVAFILDIPVWKGGPHQSVLVRL